MRLHILHIRIIFSTILLLISSNVFAQNAPMKFKNFFKDEGFPQSSVLSIAQDIDGFLWFSSYGGLTRYDGYKFKGYNANINDPFSLPGNNVEQIVFDKTGVQWLATNNGLAKYDKINDRFITYKNNPTDSNSLGLDNIRSLMVDRNNNLWIGTYGAGLNLLLNNSNKFLRFEHDPNNPYSITNNFISNIFEDSDGDIWIATDGGLNQIDTKTYKFKSYQHNSKNKKSISINNIISLAEDKFGYLWIGTWEGGLNRFDKRTREFKHYKFEQNNPSSLSSNIIRTLLYDSNNNLWIGTYGSGLDLYNYETDSFIHHKSSYSNETSISNNTILSLYEDRSGSIWVGTMFNGVNQIEPKNKFEHYTVNLESGNSISYKLISSLSEDANENIWIGTYGGGLNKFDVKRNLFTKFIKDETDNNSIRSDIIRYVFVDSDGIVWIATTSGLESINPKTNIITHHQYGIDGETTNDKHIYYIYEDSERNLWFGTWSGGLNKYERSTGKFTYYVHDKNDSSSISSNSVMAIYEDQDKNLWVGTDDKGVNLLDRTTGKFKKYRQNAPNSSRISDNKIYCFAEDSNNNLFVGTDNGLNIYNKSIDSFELIKNSEELKNATIMKIIVHDNSLWVSTAFGIIHYNLTNKSSIQYYIEDGLQENEFFMKSGIKSSNGKLYFGSINGLTTFFPKEIMRNTDIPPVVLTDFSLENNIVQVGFEYEDNIILDSVFTYIDEITLNHDQNYFSIEYAALNFHSPSKNQYNYILEGYDEDWTYVNSNRPIYYTNVDPGEYIFKVKGSNNNNIWNETPAKVKITILPPFWGTVWFKTLGVLLFLIFLFIVYKLRVKTIEKNNTRLELEVEKQTLELKKSNLILEDLNKKLSESEKILKSLNASKDKFFSIIAHDLRSPFTTLLGYTSLLVEDYDDFTGEELKESIDSINRMAHVVFSLLDNLLNWSSIHTGRMVFMPEPIQLNKMVTDILFLHNDTAQKKDIKILQDIDVDITAYADKLMIETVLRNLVSNAIKFTKYNGTITIFSKVNPKEIELFVKDTGVGISEVNIEKLFRIDVHHSTGGTDNEKGSGLGLILCKELIEKNNGTIRVKSDVSKGSTFILTLPLASANELEAAS